MTVALDTLRNSTYNETKAQVYTLRRLRRDIPDSSQYLDAVMARIVEWSHRFDGVGKPIADGAWRLYAEGTPFLGLWVALDAYGNLVGHALGDVRHWDGRMCCWVLQVVMDTPAGTALKTEFLTALKVWWQEVNHYSRAQNGPEIHRPLMQSYRITDAAWARHAGFKPYAHIYQMEMD